MTIANITQGEVFTVRVYKVYVGFAWANTYEVQATVDIPNPETAVSAVIDRIVALERAIHLDGVIIDRAIISSYVPDSVPYNPDTFASFPYSLNSQRPANAPVMPLEACLFVRRDVAVGRDGRILYRGCLTEEDVVSPAFRSQLTSTARTSIQNAISQWFGQGGLPAGWQFVMARGNPVPTNIRPVQGLTVSEKVVYKKVNNKYYDRRRNTP